MAVAATNRQINFNTQQAQSIVTLSCNDNLFIRMEFLAPRLSQGKHDYTNRNTHSLKSADTTDLYSIMTDIKHVPAMGNQPHMYEEHSWHFHGKQYPHLRRYLSSLFNVIKLQAL